MWKKRMWVLKGVGAVALFLFFSATGAQGTDCGLEAERPYDPRLKERVLAEFARLHVSENIRLLLWENFRREGLGRLTVPESEIDTLRFARIRPGQNESSDTLMVLVHWPTPEGGKLLTDGERARSLSEDFLCQASDALFRVRNRHPEVLPRFEDWQRDLLSRELVSPESVERAAVELVAKYRELAALLPASLRIDVRIWATPWSARLADYALIERFRQGKAREEALEKSRQDREAAKTARRVQQDIKRRERERRRQEAEAVAREKKRAEEAAKIAARWESERAHLEDAYRAQVEALGLFLGAEVLEQVKSVLPMFALGSSAWPTSGTPDLALSVLSALAPHALHCGADGPVAKTAETLSAQIKQLLSRHLDPLAFEKVRETWRGFESEAKAKTLERKRDREARIKEAEARASVGVDPRVSYLEWQYQRMQYFALFESSGFHARVADLEHSRRVNSVLARHWEAGARRHGPEPTGGYAAEVFFLERMQFKNRLRVVGYEAERSHRGMGSGVPDFLVEVAEGGYQALVEVKAVTTDLPDKEPVERMLVAFQHADPEIKKGSSLLPESVGKVLWLSVNYRKSFDKAAEHDLQEIVRGALPSSTEIQVVVIEIVPALGPRYLYRALVHEGGAWVDYDGVAAKHPFLDRVWDATERRHHD